MGDKDEISSKKKNQLLDKGAERAEDGKSDGVSFLDKHIFNSDEENKIQSEGFDHTKEVIRDAKTQKKVTDEEEAES